MSHQIEELEHCLIALEMHVLFVKKQTYAPFNAERNGCFKEQIDRPEFWGMGYYIFVTTFGTRWTYIGRSGLLRDRLLQQKYNLRSFSKILVFPMDGDLDHETYKEIEKRLLRRAFVRWPWARWGNREDLWTKGKDPYCDPPHQAMIYLLDEILDRAEAEIRRPSRFKLETVKFPPLTHIIEDERGQPFAYGSASKKQFKIMAGSRLSRAFTSVKSLSQEDGVYRGRKQVLQSQGFLNKVGSGQLGQSAIYFTADVDFANEEKAAQEICGSLSPQYHWRKVTQEEKERYSVVKNTYRPFELPINKMWPAELSAIAQIRKLEHASSEASEGI